MSGFAAIFRFDGAPADPAALEAMTAAMAYRGVDGVARWSGPGAALSHLMLHTTTESLEEVQPLENDDGTLVLVMDGYLANCEELRGDLLARGARLRTRSDAELVLRAFEQWGEDCVAHFDGEYAFVVWDARRREAWCAKDHAGNRPLHYHWDGHRLLVASDLAGVLAAGDFVARPNWGMVAEHLANEWYSVDETLWAGVQRLVQAHAMRVTAAGPRLRRHWMPPVEVTLRYPRDEDYREHYREVIYQAVRGASRSHRPLSCEVSGGHDSSAIFGVASRLLEQGRLPAPALKGYTYAFGPEAPAATDEIGYAREVGRHLSREIREVPPFLPELDWFIERGRQYRDIPPYPNQAMAVTIGQALVADGCRVVLNGEGGDEWLAGYPFNYAEQLAELDWRGLGRSLREDLAAGGVRRTAWAAYRYGIGPNLPGGIRWLGRTARRLTARKSMGRRLLVPELTRLLDARRAEAERQMAATVRNAGRRSLLMTLENGFTGYVRDYISRDGNRLGHDTRSPMYSRRFIEFCLAIPERQRRRGTRQKYMHLTALTDELPAAVRERTSKADFTPPAKVHLARVAELVLPRLLQHGVDWLEPGGLNALRRSLASEFDVNPYVYEPWAVFGCSNLFAGESLRAKT